MAHEIASLLKQWPWAWNFMGNSVQYRIPIEMDILGDNICHVIHERFK